MSDALRRAVERLRREAHVHLFNICSSGFHTITPYTVNAGTLTVGATDSTLFEIDNNSSFNDIMDVFCTKPGVVSACSVRPGLDTVRAGDSKRMWLVFTAGTTRGTGVMTVSATGNTDLEASDTVTVQPVQVLPKESIKLPPDTTYTQSFTVKNLSSAADTVNLTMGCPTGFTCSLLTTSPMVVAGSGSGTANVSVTTGAAGTSGSVTLTAALTTALGWTREWSRSRCRPRFHDGVGGGARATTGARRSAAHGAVSRMCGGLYKHRPARAWTSRARCHLSYSSAMAYPLGCGRRTSRTRAIAWRSSSRYPRCAVA